MNESRFEYVRPKKDPSELKRIALEVGNESVGFADLKLHHEPFEFYLVPMVMVAPEKQGRGYSSRILEEIMKRLDERGVPGLLMNAVDPQSPARGMYERHGWVPIPGHENWLGYNIGSVAQESVDQAINRLEKKRRM